MVIDYYEQEQHGERTVIYAGIQFEDEPDSLYVAELSAGPDGWIEEWRLLFNGFDCKYTFKPEEKRQLQSYLEEHGIVIRF